MEPRSNRNDRRNSQREESRRYPTANQPGRPRQNPQQKEPVGNFRTVDSRRINWENDLYERQSL